MQYWHSFGRAHAKNATQMHNGGKVADRKVCEDIRKCIDAKPGRKHTCSDGWDPGSDEPDCAGDEGGGELRGLLEVVGDFDFRRSPRISSRLGVFRVLRVLVNYLDHGTILFHNFVKPPFPLLSRPVVNIVVIFVLPRWVLQSTVVLFLYQTVEATFRAKVLCWKVNKGAQSECKWAAKLTGIPQLVLIPAPVTTTTFLDLAIASAIS